MKHGVVWWWMGMAALVCAGCLSPHGDVAKRASQAKFEFNRIVREYQVPAGDATNAVQRGAYLTNAVTAFRALAERYPDQPQWAAQSMRCIANIHRAEGRRAEALATYEQLVHRYPGEHWEVIQAWKSCGDLLWDSRMKELAREYYRQIVDTYGGPGQPPMFDTLVHIARQRLADGARP